MNVAFRVDSSTLIGSGHVMRCLALAEALADKGFRSTFVCREFQGSLISLIESEGLKVLRLPSITAIPSSKVAPEDYAAWLGISWQQDVSETIDVLDTHKTRWDWMVIDHYGINENWELAVRSSINSLLAIDDLPNRSHCADIVVNPGVKKLVLLDPKTTGLSVGGPDYVLLRRAFKQIARQPHIVSGAAKSILVFFGVADHQNMTSRVLRCLARINAPDIKLEVIVGAANSHKEKIREECLTFANATFHCNVSNIAEHLVLADFAIGAGGVSAWERSFLGVPSIIISVAKNQHPTSQLLHDQFAATYLGSAESIDDEQICAAVSKFLGPPDLLRRMAKSARALVDGRGAERVVEMMQQQRPT